MKILPTIVALAALCVWSSGCTDPASKLPVYDRVPEFSMTDSAGNPFGAKQMEGAVWIVDFIYTNCPAECPRMSSQMRKVKTELGSDSPIRFLSVSVDPDRDTPTALHAFAARWGGADAQWRFITGTPQTVHLLAFTTFHVGDVINVIEHSSKFALVDRQRTIRGYYSSFDPESLAQLRRDALSLSRSRH